MRGWGGGKERVLRHACSAMHGPCMHARMLRHACSTTHAWSAMHAPRIYACMLRHACSAIHAPACMHACMHAYSDMHAPPCMRRHACPILLHSTAPPRPGHSTPRPGHRPATPLHSTLEVAFEKLPDATHFLIEHENGLANKLRAPLPPPSVALLGGV